MLILALHILIPFVGGGGVGGLLNHTSYLGMIIPIKKKEVVINLVHENFRLE